MSPPGAGSSEAAQHLHPNNLEGSVLWRRRKRLIEESDDDEFLEWICCKKLKCFKDADQSYLRYQRKRLLGASQLVRKDSLTTMLQSDGSFWFNRKKVCTVFLQRAFGFSKDLQRSVKGTEHAPSPSCAMRIPRTDTAGKQRDRITEFLETLAESVADEMPDSSERHLPQHQKKLVYEIMLEVLEEEEAATGQELAKPSLSYFVRTWKEYLPLIKVRKVSRFAKCAECEQLKRSLSQAHRDRQACQELMKQRRAHLHYIQRERSSYMMRRRLAITEPSRHCSIVVDGADQSNFGLPHFATNCKNSSGETAGVKVIGLLQHGSLERLSLFTLTDEFQAGANHVIESIHRWLNRTFATELIPKVLFVQLDNTSRDNKNQYLMGYLECLVAWGVFEDVQASFLPVGHTHSDIDQKFSCTSKRLRVCDAVTLTDLQDQLRQSFSNTPVVTSLDHVSNISELFCSQGCLRQPASISSYYYFRFIRQPGKPHRGSGTYKTSCTAKVNSRDQWKPLFPASASHGFLKFAPDLNLTPHTKLKPPENFDSVLRRLESEEGRINDEKKYDELKEFVFKVYTPREDPFQWNTRRIIELNANTRQIPDREMELDHLCFAEYVPHNKVSYSLNTFAIVRPEHPTRECPFWVGQILEIHLNNVGDTAGVTVRWFEPADSSDVYGAAYTPSFQKLGRGRKRKIPWLGDVYTDAILFQVDKLTVKGKLGKLAVRRIEQAVHSYQSQAVSSN